MPAMWWPFGEIERQLAKIARKLTRPHCFSARLSTQRYSMLVYELTAAPVADKDVVKRVLTVMVDGAVRGEPVEFAPETVNFGEVSFEDGQSVVLTLVDMDDAGNSSEPATLEFVSADTIPPKAPGEFGVKLLREE